jgi:hypothetical protein
MNNIQDKNLDYMLRLLFSKVCLYMTNSPPGKAINNQSIRTRGLSQKWPRQTFKNWHRFFCLIKNFNEAEH